MWSVPSPQPRDALQFSSQSLETRITNARSHARALSTPDARRGQVFHGIAGDAFARDSSLCSFSGVIIAAVWFWW